jgi:hypothetical protein
MLIPCSCSCRVVAVHLRASSPRTALVQSAVLQKQLMAYGTHGEHVCAGVCYGPKSSGTGTAPTDGVSESLDDVVDADSDDEMLQYASPS